MAGSIHSLSTNEIHDHNKHIIQPPKFTWPVIRKYFITRFSSLWVGREELQQYSWNDILNPFSPLTEMNLHQWNFFLFRFLGMDMGCF